MGSAHSIHSNLGKDSTSFEAGSTGTKARWGDFEVSMGNWKENNDKTQVWGVKYRTIHEKHSTCGFQLKANHDNNGVESINFGLGDSSSNNETKFALKITRVARDGLTGGITGVDSSSGGAVPASFTRAKENYTIETTTVSYGCSKRDGLFVLEMKKKTGSENAYMVTLAHYYVAKDVGLSVMAKIGRGKNGGSGFGVEIEGPMKHPGTDLHKVIAKTCRTGVWSPNACSHCSNNGEKGKTGSKNGVSSNNNNNSNNSSLVVKDHHESGKYEVEETVKVDQVVKHDGVFWSQVIREQYNKGIINSNGNTSGSLNNSIIFFNCNF